jgi:hypothetical protein
MNMRHNYLYGTAGLTKAELNSLDPIDPQADNYSDLYGKGEASDDYSRNANNNHRSAQYYA